MKIYSKYLVIGVMILFFGASVGASVIQNINVDNANKINFNNKSNPGQINRAWSDNFDSYETGQFLDGDEEDGGWFGWDDTPQFGAYVVDNPFFSVPHSVDIVGDSDLVYEFSDYTSGEWRFMAWQYVPSDFSGESYFILLSDYADVDPGTNSKWAVQIRFDSAGIVESEFDSVNLPLITDQWVSLRTEINLDTDWFEFYYNGDLLIEKAWTAEPTNGGDGVLVIDAVDLFANGASSIYYDDLSLDVPQPPSCNADGPYGGIIGEEIEFEGTATGGIPPYEYLWDFGDDETSDEQNPTHIYANAGNYTVTLTVTDYESDTASDTTWALINGPPNAPRITGKTNVKAGVENCWTFHSDDPNGDQIKYIIDWGDGETTETDCYPSCTPVEVCHTYTEQGTYTIKAKAKECTQDGLESDWSERIVNVPRNRAMNIPFLNFLQNFLENHPNLFPILKILLLQR